MESTEFLRRAWSQRLSSRLLDEAQAIRIFHGPGEGKGPLSEISIDWFNGHCWVTNWGPDSVRDDLNNFFKEIQAKSAVELFRPKGETPKMPSSIFGEPPQEAFVVSEGPRKYLVRMLDTLHPGLFLDHAPLRDWLQGNSQERVILNAFAYTGSLSIACGIGRAKHVTTLDLSKPTVDWARENWNLNNLGIESADFIYGDYFEWLPKFKKRNRKFSMVILDPPSFSRGPKGLFSTSKDLVKLHSLALDVLESGGLLVSSINSANVSVTNFAEQVSAAISKVGLSMAQDFEVITEIQQPKLSFPWVADDPTTRYLKGLILRKK